MAGALAAAALGLADDAPVRTAPTRPGAPAPVVSAPAVSGRAVVASPPPAQPALATRRIAGVDYVSLAQIATRLGLKVAPGDGSRRIVLTGAAARAELEADERDSTINGLRVFLGHPVASAGGQLYVSRIDFERCLTPLLRPGFGVLPRPAPKIVVLDPGHGGKDVGKTNPARSIDEKTLTLDVARRAKKLLEAAGYRVVLTRDADEFVDLAPRAIVANTSRADLFVSIHFNSLVNDTRTSGVEVFSFAPQFQRSTISWSPGGKNDAESATAPVNRQDHWSTVLGQALQRRFVTDLKTDDRGKKLAHWGALRGLECPGVLVECGFITSDAEVRKIVTPAYRQQIAAAITDGIRDYADTLKTQQ